MLYRKDAKEIRGIGNCRRCTTDQWFLQDRLVADECRNPMLCMLAKSARSGLWGPGMRYDCKALCDSHLVRLVKLIKVWSNARTITVARVSLVCLSNFFFFSSRVFSSFDSVFDNWGLNLITPIDRPRYRSRGGLFVFRRRLCLVSKE